MKSCPPPTDADRSPHRRERGLIRSKADPHEPPVKARVTRPRRRGTSIINVNDGRKVSSSTPVASAQYSSGVDIDVVAVEGQAGRYVEIVILVVPGAWRWIMQHSTPGRTTTPTERRATQRGRLLLLQAWTGTRRVAETTGEGVDAVRILIAGRRTDPIRGPYSLSRPQKDRGRVAGGAGWATGGADGPGRRVSAPDEPKGQETAREMLSPATGVDRGPGEAVRCGGEPRIRM